MGLEPWHVPLLVMAGIVGLFSLYWAITWARARAASPGGAPPGAAPGEGAPGGAPPAAGQHRRVSAQRRGWLERSRLAVFSVLTVALSVMFVIVIGQDAADTLLKAVAVIPPIATAVLTVQSLFIVLGMRDEQQRQREAVSRDDPAGPASEEAQDQLGG